MANKLPVSIINLKAWRKNNIFLNGFRLTRGLFSLYQLLLSEKYTVIESFTHHSNLLGMPLAQITNIPVRIATHHGGAQGFRNG